MKVLTTVFVTRGNCDYFSVYSFIFLNISHLDVLTNSVSRMYIKSGQCGAPLTPCIKSTGNGEALFVKTPKTASGSVGIFTYDLFDISTKNSSKKMAVLFKVPFNRTGKSNMYAVGIFDISKDCDSDLFDDMSRNQTSTFVRGDAKGPSLTYQGQNVTISATMSDSYQSVLKLQVSDN